MQKAYLNLFIVILVLIAAFVIFNGLENLSNFFSGSSDYSLIAMLNNGTLHQIRILDH